MLLVLLAPESPGGNGGKTKKAATAPASETAAGSETVNVKVNLPSHSFFGLIGRVVHETEEEVEVFFGDVEKGIKHLFSKADVSAVNEPVTAHNDLPGQPETPAPAAPAPVAATAPAPAPENPPAPETPPASGS